MLALAPKQPQEITDVFVDMDGVLANFAGSKKFKRYEKTMRKPPRVYDKGFFEDLEVLPGAAWGIRVLLKNSNIKVHILTKPVTNSHICYSEKVAWIAKHFPELLKSITITHDKKLCAGPGRILIDDYAQDWKDSWEAAGGTFWHFKTERSESEWLDIAVMLHPDYFHLEHL